MRYLTLGEVLDLHARVLAQTGGGQGLRSLPALEASVAQPRHTFGGADLYPDLAEKAAMLGFGLIQGHAFVDGNKRVGHAAMEAFLLLNGWEFVAPVDDAERMILAVAGSVASYPDLLAWVRLHIRRTQAPGPAA